MYHNYIHFQRSRNEIIIFSAEFPPLNEKHILKCFLGSGVTQGHVNELGILLNISNTKMVMLREESERKGTPMFAVATVMHWFQNIARPNDIQYAYTELEDKLRRCHLNSAVGRLRSQETEMISKIQICMHMHT